MKFKKPSDPLKPVTLEGKPVQKIVAPAEIKPAGVRPAGERGDASAKEASTRDAAEGAARAAAGGYMPSSEKRREELAALLWGAAEILDDDEPIAMPPIPARAPATPSAPPAPATPSFAPPPAPAVPPTIPASVLPPVKPAPAAPRDGPTPQTPGRRMLVRRACSFPGLMRVLIPEHSFQPRLFAVRVIDLNPGGAQVETRQLTRDMSEMMRLDKRFARLEALLPGRDKMVLAGRIAWASYGTDISRMGLEFERLYPEVTDAFVADISDETEAEKLCLGSPMIDPFPSLTSRTQYTFGGYVPDAEEIIVRNGTNEVRCPVKNGRFKIEVPLALERSNFLSFTACRGSVYSVPTPACIAHQSGATDTMTFTGRKLVEEFTIDSDAQHLTLRMGGPAGQFFRVIKKLEEALEHVKEIEMAIELTGDITKIASVLESLKRDS